MSDRDKLHACMSASQASKAAATRICAGNSKCEAHWKVVTVQVTALFPIEWVFKAHSMRLFLCRDALFVLGIHSVELE
jgi:hypothetical protein